MRLSTRRGSAREQIRPHADWGFFAPGSVTRKVWGYPSSVLVGIQRATVIEELDPRLIAAVDATGEVYRRLPTRYARTVRYFAAVAFADSATVLKMADVLVKVHARAIGTVPGDGRRYDANDPDSQLWILVTAWHSVLKAYERYGPGRLSEAEERQYWAECAIAAEFQTCDPDLVPRSRAEVRAWFADWQPRLETSDAARQMMNHLLDGANEVLPSGGAWALLRPAASWSLRQATVATMPRYMRAMAGLSQSPATAALVRLYLRPVHAVVHRVPALRRAVLRMLAPSTLPVMEPHWRKIAPLSPVVLTPAQARDRYGYDRPRDAHRELRARQAARVFGEHQPPGDEGLRESEALLGTLR